MSPNMEFSGLSWQETMTLAREHDVTEWGPEEGQVHSIPYNHAVC